MPHVTKLRRAQARWHSSGSSSSSLPVWKMCIIEPGKKSWKFGKKMRIVKKNLAGIPALASILPTFILILKNGSQEKEKNLSQVAGQSWANVSHGQRHLSLELYSEVLGSVLGTACFLCGVNNSSLVIVDLPLEKIDWMEKIWALYYMTPRAKANFELVLCMGRRK